ncbi:MAG: hypothetical protein J7F05_17305 [Trichodesmium erythraeum GBRTRLIN201]|nr:hypothetical protein [Trichodesmium erythraeum GBRTRLIN201]
MAKLFGSVRVFWNDSLAFWLEKTQFRREKTC